MRVLIQRCFLGLVLLVAPACVPLPATEAPWTEPVTSEPEWGETEFPAGGTGAYGEAPNFILNDTFGDTYELGAFRGYPVLLNFWATWCGPCLAEMPALQSIYDKYQNQGLVVLAINADGESLEDVQQYRQDNVLSFPLLIDLEEYTSSDYEINAFPTSYFIDRQGTIQYVSEGALEQQDFENILNSTILRDNSGLAVDSPGQIWFADITESHVYEYFTASDEFFTNFTVQTDVQINTDAYEFHGLFFRQQDGSNFYSFRITPDGYYAFDIWETGEYSFTTILGPTQSEYIYQGVGATNTLQVTANYEIFDLYINDQYVGSVSDAKFPDGKVGVLSCTCDGSDATSATYSNFSLIRQP